MNSIPTIAPGTTKIGWIGTGVMGASMCGHLLKAGFATTVFTRSREKAQGLLDQGAEGGETAGDGAERSDEVLACSRRRGLDPSGHMGARPRLRRVASADGGGRAIPMSTRGVRRAWMSDRRHS